MGNVGAHRLGLKEAPVSIKDSVDGMVKIIDDASKETHGGSFWEYNGKRYPW